MINIGGGISIGTGIRIDDVGITATGGTITTFTSGNVTYQVHTFTTSSSFVVSSLGSLGDQAIVDYLVVGGGGGGGTNGGGGGGGGQVIAGTYTPTVDSFTITVGTGGAAGDPNNANVSLRSGANGNSSIAFSQTALGGGGGCRQAGPGNDGASGGGAGGAVSINYPGGAATGGGNAGGDTGAGSFNKWGGGGGGWTSAGALGNTSGIGGAGYSSTITGTTQYYAAGGGGGWCSGSDTGNVAVGGSGVGGNGAYAAGFSSPQIFATNPTQNSGSGGGSGAIFIGLYENMGVGTAGADGIVIIRYPISIS